MGHAYLFTGPRGCGKTSVARILAHAVNDFGYSVEDDYVDIVEIDGASNRGIDNIRELREKVMIAPTAGKYKVYIIDEVHMLTKEAFNALLKTLEEPPAHAIFIMATTDAYKVPVTITSRAQTYTFKLAEPAVILEHLKTIAEKEQIKISDEALEIIARRGGGSFRDSLSLLDQISTLSDEQITREMVIDAMGLPEDEKITELLANYANADVVKITTSIKELLIGGIKAETIAEELIRQIIAEPQAELLPLLAKLPEVKAPYAEARLLVTLVQDKLPMASGAKPTTSPPLGVKTPISSPLQTDSPKQPEVYNSEHGNQKMSSKETTPITPIEPAKSEIVSFDWNDFLTKVKAESGAVYMKLSKAQHVENNDSVEIYPSSNPAYLYLSKDNVKAILTRAAGIRVIVHAAGEAPQNVEKDAGLAQISAIMGGEVINDGGRSPF